MAAPIKAIQEIHLIKDIEQLSGAYNMIIGLVYCFVPYLIAINVELIKINRNDILFKITKQQGSPMDRPLGGV